MHYRSHPSGTGWFYWGAPSRWTIITLDILIILFLQQPFSNIIFIRSNTARRCSISKLQCIHIGFTIPLPVQFIRQIMFCYCFTGFTYDLIALYIPSKSLGSSNKSLLIVPAISDQKWVADLLPLLRLPFEILFLNIFAHSLSAFRGSLKTFLYQQSLNSAIIAINSLQNVSLYFDPRTYNGFNSLLIHGYPGKQ